MDYIMNCGLRQSGENLYIDQDSRLFTLSEGEDFDSFSFVSPNLDEPSVRLNILNINTFLHQNFFTWYGRIKAQALLNKVIRLSRQS